MCGLGVCSAADFVHLDWCFICPRVAARERVIFKSEIGKQIVLFIICHCTTVRTCRQSVQIPACDNKAGNSQAVIKCLRMRLKQGGGPSVKEGVELYAGTAAFSVTSSSWSTYSPAMSVAGSAEELVSATLPLMATPGANLMGPDTLRLTQSTSDG
jgi:hypothetical protein